MKRAAKSSFIPKAFTLIELLIVVAIIAILAAIAVPNFLEAQTRAKVSRVVADMRSYDTGVEMYRIDHSKTPPTDRNAFSPAPSRTWISKFLTTPISYINGAFPDVFNKSDQLVENRVLIGWGDDYLMKSEATFAKAFKFYPNYSDGNTKLLRPKLFYMFSAGPDQKFDFNDTAAGRLIQPYDSTNGTISRGDINRFNG